MSDYIDQFTELDEEAWDFYQKGDYRRASELYREARLLADANEDFSRKVNALSWEGDSFASIGEVDTALAVLLEGATTDPEKAPPLDIYDCWVAAVDLCINKKPYAFIRKHIEELYQFVERFGIKRAIHRLHYTDGTAELAHGNLEAARNATLRSWETHVEEVPYLTPSTHLYQLCEIYFRLKDKKSLAKWVGKIEKISFEVAQDGLQARLARLWLCRARGLQRKESGIARSVAEKALEQLDTMSFDAEVMLYDALRALMLLGDFKTVDSRVERITYKEDFDLLLFKGDYAFTKARVELGLPVVDDEWEEDSKNNAQPLHSATTQLEVALGFYRRALDQAKEDDERLKTNWRTRALYMRIEKLNIIQRLL